MMESKLTTFVFLCMGSTGTLLAQPEAGNVIEVDGEVVARTYENSRQDATLSDGAPRVRLSEDSVIIYGPGELPLPGIAEVYFGNLLNRSRSDNASTTKSINEMTGLTEEDAETYLSIGSEYLQSLSSDANDEWLRVCRELKSSQQVDAASAASRAVAILEDEAWYEKNYASLTSRISSTFGQDFLVRFEMLLTDMSQNTSASSLILSKVIENYGVDQTTYLLNVTCKNVNL